MGEELGRVADACRDEPAFRPDEIDIPDATHELAENPDDVRIREFPDERRLGEEPDPDAGQDPRPDPVDGPLDPRGKVVGVQPVEQEQALHGLVARKRSHSRLAQFDRNPREDRRQTFGMEIEQVGAFDPVKFDDGCVKAVRDAADRLGYKHRNIVSGAGHDACWVNRVAPTAMVMCPCVDGLSHNEDEDIKPEWATAGADVLFHAVVETAEIVP